MNNNSKRPVGYKGLKNIKQAGVVIPWTQEMRDEYDRCADDIVYFLSNYVKITHPDAPGLVPFQPYDFQIEMLELMDKERFVVAKLARQCGKSTIMLGYVLHYILFNEYKNVVILAHTHATSKKLIRQLKEMYGNLPLWIQQGVEEWNKQDITLENSCRVSAKATSPDVTRGDTINLMVMDEFAFVEPSIAEEFYVSSFPTISAGVTTKLFIISTPKGMNHFYKIWKDAERDPSEEGYNGFKTFTRDYTCVPGRGAEYAKMMLQKLGEVKFNQEVLCQFIGSANTLIRGDKLASLSYEKPSFTQPNFDVYQQVKPQHSYVVTVDPAGGKLGDYTVVSVFDVTEIPYHLVAKYRTNEMSTLAIPSTIFSIATHYNMAHILVETNYGNEIALSLYYDHQYENMLFTTARRFEKQTLSMGWGDNANIGVRMSSSIKRIGCSNLKTLIEMDKLVFTDYDAIHELGRFVAKRGSYEADSNSDHDDVVMSMVLFAWMTTQPTFRQISDTNVKRAIHDENFNQQVMPFGYIVTGTNNDQIDQERFFRDKEGTLWETVEYNNDDMFGWPVPKK